jgi:hypothetical protein
VTRVSDEGPARLRYIARTALWSAAAALAFGVCLSEGIAAGQRDASAVVTGTARVSGIVVTQDSSPQPVRRAIVSLSGDAFALSRNAITDDAGRFDFAGVPAGRFKIAATRPGYVSIAYGAMRPGRPGTALVVEAGQQIADIPLQLVRGAVIVGTVRDARGELVPGLSVRLTRRDAGGKTSTTVGATTTDDRGTYRLFGLAAGAYLVEARPYAPVGGAFTAPSDAEVDAALANLRVRRSGASSPSGAPQTTGLPERPSRNFAFVPIFYPSAIAAADATPIVVAAGEERSDVDVTLQMVSPTTIDGVVLPPVGQPMPSVRLSLTTEASPSPQGAPFLTLQGGGDGRFRYPNVAPGNYVLTALAMTDTSLQLNFGLMSAQAAAARGPQPCFFATADIAATGGDVSGVSLVLRPCLKIEGCVVFDGATLAAPKDLMTLQVTTMMRQASVANGFGPIFGVTTSPIMGTTLVDRAVEAEVHERQLDRGST